MSNPDRFSFRPVGLEPHHFELIERESQGERVFGRVATETRAKQITDALNRPRYLYQVWACVNDTNGNPRRITVVYYDGRTVAELDHGYAGDRIPRGAVQLPTVNVTPTEYNAAIKRERHRGTARRWLSADMPTEIEKIGRTADTADNLRRDFKIPAREWDAVRDMIWTLEAHRDEGIPLGVDAPEVRS